MNPESPNEELLGNRHFELPRRRWPGVLAVVVIGIGIAAAALTSVYDPRTLMRHVQAQVSGRSSTAGTAAPSGDAAITAAVKTALASDPALGAQPIDVSTQAGVVRLEGPAPDAPARERAQVIASASPGVTRVDNRLVVAAETSTH